MSALNTDLVRNATPNFATTLANSMLVSDTSMTLQSATGLPTATAITLVIDATDPVSGLPTPTLKEVMTGTLSGTTVSNLLRGQDSTTAQGHASGANVVMWITANLWNDFQAAYLVGHTQLGAHVSNLPLTSPKITTGLNDSNNVKVLGVTATSSAVNQVNIADSATGLPPIISATGTDTNINLQLKGKGNGAVDLAIPYKFSVYRNAAQVSGNGSYALVGCDTKVFDTGSNVDIVTNKGRFTVVLPGFYFFTGEVAGSVVNDNQQIRAGLWKNGSTVQEGSIVRAGGASSLIASTVSTLLQLTTNDYIELVAFGDGSALSVGSPTFTNFQGFFVSAT